MSYDVISIFSFLNHKLGQKHMGFLELFTDGGFAEF